MGEAAKKVADLLQQAHNYVSSLASLGGVKYAEGGVGLVRDAVKNGNLSQQVLDAVEAANLPNGSDKLAAIERLRAVLQPIIH